MSRRGFVAGAAAAGAVLALPKRARASGQQPSITIVGGGVAGLNCALNLRDLGYDSTVYEASGRLGGRMFSNTNYWAAGQVSEWCGELIDTGHKTIRQLAARYGLPLDNLHAAEPNNSEETYFFDGQYYPKAQADADFLAIFDQLNTDSNDAGYPTTWDSYTTRGFQLDHTTVYDYIDQLIPGGHGTPLGQLLDVAYNIEFGAETNLQSALNLIYLLAFQPTDDSLDMFGESDEKFHVRGGNQQIPLAIANDIGNQVKTSHSLCRVRQTPGGRYTCTFQRNNGSIDVTSDIVVFALPFAVLAGIDTSNAGFDARKNDAIQHLGRGHSGKLQMQFDARIWNNHGPWPHKSNGTSYADTGYQSSWDVTRAQPGTQGILVQYSGGNTTDAMRTNVPFTTVQADYNVQRDINHGFPLLSQTFPGLSWNGRATQSLPAKSEYFNLAYSYWKKGQYTSFGGYEGTRIANLFFCGEHTSQDFQGYMEGGAGTGEKVAKHIARRIENGNV
ncbi:MAG TPA: NAD(P)/FAD-dependent oxidoreductase [Kofleriaceae bacterium]